MKTGFLIILFFLPITLSGQRSISGRITDAADRAPIPAATVFIANTTIGAVADAEGYYSLKIPGEGSYRLTVSHAGYQPAFITIKPGKVSIVCNVALNIRDLDEVTVTQKVRARKKDITLFWRTLLGRNPSKRTIYAVNPKDVFYFYDSKKKLLNVSCHEPLQIINNETGYQLQLILDRFTHNYNTGISWWKTEFRFTELDPKNNRQKTAWNKKRQQIYKVSYTNFIKSLYHNTLMENGYLLTYPQKKDAYNNVYHSYENADNFLSVDSLNDGKIFNIPADVKYLMLVCFGEPISQSILEDVSQVQESGIILPVINRNRQGSQQNWAYTGMYRNMIETPDGPVHIFPDGTTDYDNPVLLSPFLFSNSLTGINMMLPLDDVPIFDAFTMSPDNEDVLAENEWLEDMLSPADDDFSHPIANIADSVYEWFNEQLKVFPQEKIHLHTDRNRYVSGEKIWFKAYIADALTHGYSTNNRYVYVELISPTDSLVKRVMVRQVDGMMYGNLPLAKDVPTGNYTLRAYTRYMENMGDDYFFKKNIRIENLFASDNPQRPTARSETMEDDYDVSFFPEGGNLPEGVISKVAFKALNRNGYPETIVGTLVDDTGVAIPGYADVPSASGSVDVPFSSGYADVPSALPSIQSFHAGMGVFEYLPEAGTRTYLKCKNSNGLEKQFELPPPDAQACSLTASLIGDSIVIGVNRSVYMPDRPFYLLAHCRGEVLYFSEWEWEWEKEEENKSGRDVRVPGLESGQDVRVPGFESGQDVRVPGFESGQDVRVPGVLFTQDEFPAGVIQFVLFDEQMNPLSERLVFSKNYDKAAVEFHTDKASYKKRENIRLTLKTPSEPLAPSSIRAITPSEPLAPSSIRAITPPEPLAPSSIRAITPPEPLAPSSIRALTPPEPLAPSSIRAITPPEPLAPSSIRAITPSENVMDTSLTRPPARNAFEGLFSITVTDDRDVAVDSSTSILSSMLLSSELKGYIENPALYLQETDESAIALDYLMLTHGWRRYNIPEMVKGELAYPQIPFQTNQKISGKVKTLSPSGAKSKKAQNLSSSGAKSNKAQNLSSSGIKSNKAKTLSPSGTVVADREITVLTQDGDFGITATDEQGTFTFPVFEFSDSTSFFIHALNREGSNRVELVIDKETFPELSYAIQTPVPEIAVDDEDTKNEDEANAFFTKAVQRSKNETVTVTTKRNNKEKGLQPQKQNWWSNTGADVNIRKSIIQSNSNQTVADLLSLVAGVEVFPDGQVTILGSKPLILIDGMPTPWNNPADFPLEQVRTSHIESIDIFKGPSVSKFGALGGRGVISITRKGRNIYRERDNANYTIHTPLGYQKPEAFYSPVYETLDAKYLPIPDNRTTIFWKPDILFPDTGEVSFDFYASDFPTTYSVVIEGVTSDGRIVRQVEKIRIE